MTIQSALAIALCSTPAFLSLAMIARADDPDLIVSAPTQAPYTISGLTAADLRSKMNQLGPFSAKENRRFDAKTVSTPFANFTSAGKKGKSCRIKSVKVTVTTQFILPQWTPPVGVDSALVAKWNAYLAKVQIHEKGHQQLSIDAGKDLLAKLKALPEATSCPALLKSAQTVQQQAQAALDASHEKYDTGTQHGETQGAKFP
ncbi:MAG: DUF922 domain-containing Zn-dependent protease [Plectolyngbya sp. WJT66-NPBG17]|jgi:predicted secreted Zn-dependent protease|nr:DUF922 domain-containing Zn-dependent protease [Plectolyngbya sp. WJT66-NPBG17]